MTAQDRLSHQELQEVQRALMIRFAEFCDRHGLVYYLHGGTLLGAAMWSDFIPWDDDVDLSMPRPDFERLVALHDDPELADLVVMEARTDAAYPFAYAKLGARGTAIVDRGMGGREVPINVDIFPLDALAPRGWRRRLQAGLLWLPHLLIVLGLDSRARGWRRWVVAVVRPVAWRIGLNRLARMVSRVARAVDVRTADNMGLLVWGPLLPNPMPAWNAAEARLPFGDRTFRVPADHRAVLTRQYGPGWLEPYPEHLRFSPHGFQARREGTGPWLSAAPSRLVSPGDHVTGRDRERAGAGRPGPAQPGGQPRQGGPRAHDGSLGDGRRAGV